jgi:uncharacterized protein (DUF58 family)
VTALAPEQAPAAPPQPPRRTLRGSSVASVRRARDAASRSTERLRDLSEPARARVAPYAERGAAAVTGPWSALSTGGRVALIGAILGIWIGLWQGWRELLVLGATCLLALLLAVLWTLGRSSLSVAFGLASSRVTVGETASGRVALTNTGRRTHFPSRIELAVGRGSAFFMLPALSHGQAHEQFFDVPTRRRSVIRVGPVSSVRTDPLHLVRREQEWSDSVDLYVHPRTVPLGHDSTGFIRDIEGITTQALTSNDVSFHALREYQPGDDRRAIHWRTTARVGKLMVRQFEETRRAHLLIVLPTALADYATEDDFETAISVAGSLARHAFREERQVSIYTTSGLIAASTGALMLDRLAELEPARSGLSLRDLAARATNAVPGASVCALLAGAPAEPRDIRAAHRTLPASVATFALRCAADATINRRRIADLSVVDLPSVDLLPRAMRSLA